MKKNLTVFLLLLLFVACSREENKESATTESTKSFPAVGVRINPDSVAQPVIVTVDESKVVRTKAGTPVVVALKGSVVAGSPVALTVDESKLKRIVPGRDSLKAPSVTLYKDSSAVAGQPRLTDALAPRMKDNASFNMQYLDAEQGLISSYINCVYQDKRGNKWIATDGGGLVLYDGTQFRNFTKSQGLSSNGVFCVLEDNNSNLWMGTNDGGAVKYDGLNFTYVNEASGLPNNSVKTIMQDSKGNFWFGTYSGISKFDGKQVTTYAHEQGLTPAQVMALQEDREGNIWIGTFDNGLFRFDGTEFIQYSSEVGVPADNVVDLLLDKSGALWIGTFGGGLYRYADGQFEVYTTAQGLMTDHAISLMEDHEGNLWFSEYGGGITKHDGKMFYHYTVENGLSSDAVFSMMEDESYNLWVGTNGGGITVFNENSFRFFTTREGLPDNVVLSTLEDRNGMIWFGTNEGLVKYDGTSFSIYTTEQGLPGNRVTSLHEDASGNIWIGTGGMGIARYDGAYFSSYSSENGLVNNGVMNINDDKEGNIWIATQHGISKFNGKTFTNYGTEQGLTSPTVLGVLQDSKNNIWFATNVGGLLKFDGTGFTAYGKQDGLKDNSVFSLYEDKAGILWFGTNGGGVTRFDGTDFIPYTSEDGLSDNIVWSITEDRDGVLWLGTEKGLNSLAPALDANGKYAPVITPFKKEDGLKCEDFYEHSVLLDSRNRMWWGGGKALTMLDLNCYRMSHSPPRVQLNSIYLDEQYFDFQEAGKTDSSAAQELPAEVKFDSVSAFYNYPLNVTLPYDVNHVTFNFSAVDWGAPHKVKYQYKLEGLDADWSRPTSETKADYRNIPPGRYTFNVMATGGAGVHSESFAYTFTVSPPWWQTWWARVLYVMLGVAAVYGIVRWNSKKLRERASLLTQKVREATSEISSQKQEIEEKHKEITDSINYAERIQRSLLASDGLLKGNLPEHFVLFQPKAVVSGDFYWASEAVSDGQRFLLCVGDSTGHGVPGAIMSILNIACLEKAVEAEKLSAPDQILNYTRSKVIDVLKKDGSEEGGKDGMDCSLVQFDFDKQMMHVAAAYNAVWIVRGEEIIEIKADKMPVGRHEMQAVPFSLQTASIQKGDMIFLFTDGYADQFGGRDGKKFMGKNLRKMLAANASLSMDEQKSRLQDAFRNWIGSLEQVDDVCVIGVRV